MTEEEIKAKIKELKQERARINKQIMQIDKGLGRYGKALVRSYAAAAK